MASSTKLSRRDFLRAAGGVGISALVVACAPAATTPTTGGGPGEEVITLSFWHHFAGPTGEEMQKVIDNFNDSRSDIQVNPNVVPFAASAEYSQKMTAAAASGQPPDMFLNPSGGWAVGLDLAISLNPFMERDGISLDDYYPGAVQRVMWEGEAVGIPFNMDTRAIWWNKQLFEEAGLDPEVPPTTWDELEAFSAQLLKRDGNGDIEVNGFMPDYDQAWVYGFIYQNGGLVQSIEPCHRPPELLFDTETGWEAAEVMKRLVDINGGPDLQNAFLSSFTGGANDAFLMNQMAMVYTGPWYLPAVRQYRPDMEFGIAPEPLGPRATGNATMVGGFEVSIPKLSQSAEAAWEFTKYMGTLEVQIPMSQSAGNTPGHRVPADHPYLQEDPLAAYFVTAGDWSISFPESPWAFPLFFALKQDAMQAIYAEEMNVQEAFADAREKVQVEIDRWYENHPEGPAC